MKSLPDLSRLQFWGNRPTPLYRKLLFQNKILLIIFLLLTMFGLFGKFALQWVLKVHLIEEHKMHFQSIADSLSHRLESLLLIVDNNGINHLLSDENQLHESIIYLIVTDASEVKLGQSLDEGLSRQYNIYKFDRKSNNQTDHQEIKTYSMNTIEIASPITHRDENIGTIKIGLSTLAIDTFMNRVMTLYLGILGVMIVITITMAKFFLRYTTRPIATLTHIADEISVGNLDLDILFGKRVNCWEIKKCGRKDCAAYTNTAVQCWFVDGTPCEGYEPKFPQKLEGCRKCEVYKTHKGDEVVQLADSFQNMIYIIKASQAELERSYKFQRNLIQNSLGGIIATNEMGVIKIFNRVAQSFTGYSESEVIDTLTLEDFFCQDIATKIDRPLIYDYGIVLRGFKPTESEIINKNKETMPVRISGTNLYEQGEHLGKVFFFQDLREVKQLRRELIQSERLGATGQAVASISHSIKNILDGLLGGLYIYKKGRRINDEKDTEKGWRMMEKNIDLISELVINLLNYAKDREPALEKCSPKDIVEDVIETMENKALNKNICMVSEYEGDFDDMYMDSHAVHQCLMNLVSNAIDATPPGNQGRIIIRLESENGRGIILEVTDNGIGMSKEIQGKIFQGMFSTKGSTGTGIGLLVIKKTVSELGGSINVESEENKGSSFRIWLPNNNPDARVSGMP